MSEHDADSLHFKLGEISAKLDALMTQRGDHEARLRVLEKARYKLIGMATAAAIAAGLLADFVGERIAPWGS